MNTVILKLLINLMFDCNRIKLRGYNNLLQVLKVQMSLGGNKIRKWNRTINYNNPTM